MNWIVLVVIKFYMSDDVCGRSRDTKMSQRFKRGRRNIDWLADVKTPLNITAPDLFICWFSFEFNVKKLPSDIDLILLFVLSHHVTHVSVGEVEWVLNSMIF